MTEIMTPSNMTTAGQIDKAVANYRALLEKHARGFSAEAVQTVLGQPELAVEQLAVFRRRVAAISNLIDLDAQPFTPDGWSVEEHQKGGSWRWDASQVELYLASGQKNGNVINGNKLRMEMAKKPILNANVLDYLLASPHLIPEEWKGKAIFFWGTIYRHRDGSLHVRYLYWLGGRWDWGSRWLVSGWLGSLPAALRAS